ncbi:unnamed protein product [Effrenium voratum]|nr:unnamed protein product [Effrenium voratum]
MRYERPGSRILLHTPDLLGFRIEDPQRWTVVTRYVVDWYIFLRHSRRPPVFDEMIARVCVNHLLFALVFRSATSILVWVDPTLFDSSVPGCSVDANDADALRAKYYQENFLMFELFVNPTCNPGAWFFSFLPGLSAVGCLVVLPNLTWVRSILMVLCRRCRSKAPAPTSMDRDEAISPFASFRWLRCAGWCLPERQLSDMLSEQRQRSKLGALPKEERWGLRQLLEVLERNKSRENTSLKTLQQALRTLAKNRSKISKERLLRVSKADLVVSELGLESKRILDCDALAERVLQRICEPSVPSWAGPSVFVTVKRDNAPDVRIKYASHAQLDLLFDIYCRKIQVDRSQVRFVLDGAELEDEDTFEGLHLTSQDAIKAIVLPPRNRDENTRGGPLRARQRVFVTHKMDASSWVICDEQQKVSIGYASWLLLTIAMRLCLLALGPLAAAVAALWPLIWRLWRIPQVLVAPKDKAPDALRLGILGASFIAQAAVVHAAAKRRDVAVLALAARSAEKARRFAERFGVPQSFGGPEAYAALLAMEELDAVYISLPTSFHLHWALAALNAGKHVLLEKPAVLDASEAEVLLEAAKKSRKVVFEAAHYRFHPAARRFKQLVSAGSTPPNFLEVRFSMLDPPALLARLGDSDADAAESERSQAERQHERVKNLDRWWYCVDMLMWSTGAKDAEVLAASETRFAMSAALRLSPQLTANISMARDSLMDPFTWTVAARSDTEVATRTQRPSMVKERPRLSISWAISGKRC